MKAFFLLLALMNTPLHGPSPLHIMSWNDKQLECLMAEPRYLYGEVNSDWLSPEYDRVGHGSSSSDYTTFVTLSDPLKGGTIIYNFYPGGLVKIQRFKPQGKSRRLTLPELKWLRAINKSNFVRHSELTRLILEDPKALKR